MKGKNRLRRTLMFVSAQTPGLVKEAYIYGADSIILDLEDAVAENQKDAARFSLYHALKTVDFMGAERIVRINGMDTPHWKEDIRAAVAGGADVIRIPKCDSAADVVAVEQYIKAVELEFNRPDAGTLIMAAMESPKAVLRAEEICTASERLVGIALSGGDFRKSMQTKYYPSGNEILAARGLLLLAARAAGVQCYDTIFSDLNDMEGFRVETVTGKEMGFDGKSVVSPRQIQVVHEVFAPSEKEMIEAERTVRAIRENAERGIGIFTLDGKMLDVAFLPGAERVLELAKASGLYKGDLV
ncbi:MAG: aldolase/citrate lyase family protein [Oscillospiraceae bacterium]|nr:aldolase/citrate lyase family protein [Oscillospiraceae bacterium]